MKLLYSQDGAYNRSLMANARLVFYVEEDNREFAYEMLFEKIFQISPEMFFVCSLGGKKNVIDAYNKNKFKNYKKVFLYIVDGDFDILSEEFEIKDDIFLYLIDII